MRFAFNILDHRVSLSIARYSAPAITFENDLPQGSVVPQGAVYDAAYVNIPDGGSDYIVHVNEGARFLWTKGANDSFIQNAGSLIKISSTGSIIASAFLVKASPSVAEMTAWGGVRPDTMLTADGVALGVGDLFLVQGFQNLGSPEDNGIFQITDAAGHYAESVAPLGGAFTVRVTEGTENLNQYFYFTLLDAFPTWKIWAVSPGGQVHLRLGGIAGSPVTALLQPLP